MNNLKKKNSATNSVAAFCSCWCGCSCACEGIYVPSINNGTLPTETEAVQRMRGDQMQLSSKSVQVD